MIDDVGDIADYYNANPESEHIRLQRHQLEYELTWRYLDRYLPAQGSILEVGSATGRYTVPLAKRGYRLTAVDMSAALLEMCRQNLVDEGVESRVRLVAADARDLAEVTEREFDAVLLMGPLYHLVEEADRRSALKEAYVRLRAGGVLFSAFISRFGVLCDLIKDAPAWVEEHAEVRSMLERGRRAGDSRGGGFRGYFATISEIAPLHEAIGFETVKVVGVEPVIAADDDCYNRLQGRQRQLWLDLLDEISAEGSIIGASRHLLYIGKKK